METYTLEDLVWAIEGDRGQFSLFFVRCNYPKLRDEMMQQLRESCAIASLQLQPGDESLYRILKAFVAAENPPALMIYGFEDVENIVELLTSTNNLREKFSSDFQFPVVFWVSDTAIAQFEKLAMDFKSFGKSISLPISVEAAQVNLQDKIELFFNRVLSVGGDNFIANEDILENSYQSELDSSLADIQQFETGLSLEIEGSLELIQGRDAHQHHKIEEAIAHYQKTSQLWQDVKDISPLKEAVLLFHLGLCDRALAEKEEEKEKQRSYWRKAKEYFANCLEKLQLSQREDLAANFINELGEAFLNLQDWQSLKELALQSIEAQKTDIELTQFDKISPPNPQIEDGKSPKFGGFRGQISQSDKISPPDSQIWGSKREQIPESNKISPPNPQVWGSKRGQIPESDKISPLNPQIEDGKSPKIGGFRGQIPESNKTSPPNPQIWGSKREQIPESDKTSPLNPQIEDVKSPKIGGFRGQIPESNKISPPNPQVWGSKKGKIPKSYYNRVVQLARAYGFLTQVALKEENWQEADLTIKLALETLESLPLAERKNKAIYLLMKFAQLNYRLQERNYNGKIFMV